MNPNGSQPNTSTKTATTTKPITPTTQTDGAFLGLLKQINKDNMYTYANEKFKWLSPFEMRQALAPEETSALAETYLTRSVPTIEGLRNALVVVPITITWLSLALAAAAYQQTVALLPSGATVPSFFQLWQEGFPQLQVVQVGFLTLHLTPGRPHFFAFSNIAFLDFLILVGMLLLTALAQMVIASAANRARRLQLWLEGKLYTWSINSLTWGPRPDLEDATWAGKVEDALRRLDLALGGVRESLGDFTAKLESQATYMQGALQAGGDIAKTASELTDIYQAMADGSREIRDTIPRVAKNLDTITKGQQNTSETWRHAANQLDNAARSLATLTSSLTGDPRFQEEVERVRRQYPLSYAPQEPPQPRGLRGAVTGWWRRLTGHP